MLDCPADAARLPLPQVRDYRSHAWDISLLAETGVVMPTVYERVLRHTPQTRLADLHALKASMPEHRHITWTYVGTGNRGWRRR